MSLATSVCQPEIHTAKKIMCDKEIIKQIKNKLETKISFYRDMKLKSTIDNIHYHRADAIIETCDLLLAYIKQKEEKENEHSK